MSRQGPPRVIKWLDDEMIVIIDKFLVVGGWYDLEELAPVFVSKEAIVRRVRQDP